MSYSVPCAASELMLEPSELKGVLDLFFRSAPPKIQDAKIFLESLNFTGLSRSMHALKGLALSLHMSRMGELAAKAERSDLLSPESLNEIIRQLEIELHEIQNIVDEYYQNE